MFSNYQLDPIDISTIIFFACLQRFRRNSQLSRTSTLTFKIMNILNQFWTDLGETNLETSQKPKDPKKRSYKILQKTTRTCKSLWHNIALKFETLDRKFASFMKRHFVPSGDSSQIPKSDNSSQAWKNQSGNITFRDRYQHLIPINRTSFWL